MKDWCNCKRVCMNWSSGPCVKTMCIFTFRSLTRLEGKESEREERNCIKSISFVANNVLRPRSRTDRQPLRLKSEKGEGG